MAGHIVVMKFTGRHWLALAPSNVQSSPREFACSFQFSPTKDLAPFSIHTPQKPYFKPINNQFIVADIC